MELNYSFQVIEKISYKPFVEFDNYGTNCSQSWYSRKEFEKVAQLSVDSDADHVRKHASMLLFADP